MHAVESRVEPVIAACGVAEHALKEASLDDVAALRDRPSPAGVGPLPPRFLRHADEQTVVAIRAVLDAMAAAPVPRGGHSARGYVDYGVVAAPCQAGRITAAQSLKLLRSGGPVTVSPHIVPQCSLHSIAGAVSVALGMHGPNVGVSGGPQALAEGLLACLTLLNTPRPAAEGIWFIATAWDTEPSLAPEEGGVAVRGVAPTCVALAVALTASRAADPARVRLTLRATAGRIRRPNPHQCIPPAVAIRRFAHALDGLSVASCRAGWAHACPGGDEVCLEPAAHVGLRHTEAA